MNDVKTIYDAIIKRRGCSNSGSSDDSGNGGGGFRKATLAHSPIVDKFYNSCLLPRSGQHEAADESESGLLTVGPFNRQAFLQMFPDESESFIDDLFSGKINAIDSFVESPLGEAYYKIAYLSHVDLYSEYSVVSYCSITGEEVMRILTNSDRTLFAYNLGNVPGSVPSEA